VHISGNDFTNCDTERSDLQKRRETRKTQNGLQTDLQTDSQTSLCFTLPSDLQAQDLSFPIADPKLS
jgi:hypothetical protein